MTSAFFKRRGDSASMSFYGPHNGLAVKLDEIRGVAVQVEVERQ